MSSDYIIKGKDNRVRISISIDAVGFSDLLFFDYIKVEYGADTWQTDTDPSVVYLEQNSNNDWAILVINAGSTTESEARFFTITGYNSSTYPNGFQFTSKCMGNLELPNVC